MGDKTKIEWADASWNPLRGTIGKWHCVRVSPGCGQGKMGGCYAEAMNQRFKGPAYKVGADTPRLDSKALAIPLHWRKPRRVFVCSMTDLFLEAHPFEWIASVFGVMAASPQHTFQVLTKRPARALAFFEWAGNQRCHGVTTAEAMKSVAMDALGPREPDGRWNPTQRKLCGYDRRWPLPNVWLGVSCEDQQRADERIPLLLQCPAAVRFVSAEPLLGPLRLDVIDESPTAAIDALRGRRNATLGERIDEHPRLDWVIVGGESGPGARVCDAGWVRSIVRQCREAGVACFVKQLGAVVTSRGATTQGGPRGPWKLKHSKGGDPNEWPEDLRVREWPEVTP